MSLPQTVKPYTSNQRHLLERMFRGQLAVKNEMYYGILLEKPQNFLVEARTWQRFCKEGLIQAVSRDYPETKYGLSLKGKCLVNRLLWEDWL